MTQPPHEYRFALLQTHKGAGLLLNDVPRLTPDKVQGTSQKLKLNMDENYNLCTSKLLNGKTIEKAFCLAIA